MAEEGIIIDLDEFIRSKYPLPPSSHPVNRVMGVFTILAMKHFALSFYKENHTNLDEYQLLLEMRKKYPSENQREYTYALERGRIIFAEFKRVYRQGIIHGVPCPKKTVGISNGIFLEGKPTLIARNTKEIFLIKTFSLHFPLKQEMPDVFYQTVGLSLLYPPPYRMWLCGFSGTGQLQTKIIEPSSTDREDFIFTLKKYTKKKVMKNARRNR